jgi:hypothetical protein
MKKRVLQAVAVCSVAFILVVLFFQLHLVRDWAEDSALLWNSEEAYLFVGWPRSGYHFTGFQFLLELVPAYFGVNHTVDDKRFSTIVIRITRSDVERYVVDDLYGAGFRAYIPYGNTIYGYNKGATLWKWVGDHFRQATPEEQPAIPIDEQALLSHKDFTNVDGWSARHSITIWPPQSEIKVADETLKFLVKLSSSGEELSLDMQRGGSSPQMILHVERKLHLVSKSEYNRIFSQR